MNTMTAQPPCTLEDFEAFVEAMRFGGSRTNPLIYPALGIAGEGGEFADKVKKYLRGDYQLDVEHKRDMALELGDILWYVTAAAQDLGFTLSHILALNYHKLALRHARGTLKGNGDHR